MRKIVDRRTAGVVAGIGAVALIVGGCSGDDSSTASTTSQTPTAQSFEADRSATTQAPAPSETTPSETASPQHTTSGSAPSELTVKGVDDGDVTMTGPIAARYSKTTAAEKKMLGLPLTGDRNAGTRDSGVVFQQFQHGVITARNAKAGTPAYLTWGKIREAWNVERDSAGKPVPVGKNGSAGPLGAVTSDVTTAGTVQSASFEHGKVSYDTATGTVTVTVNGKEVPAGL